VRKLNRKVLGIAVVLLAVAMLATPLVSAKPTIESVEFRIESWPYLSGDFSKSKSVTAGESGNKKVIRIPTYGEPLLVDDVPSTNPLDPTYWFLLFMAQREGVRLTINGDDPMEGTVEQMALQTITFADGSWTASEKWTFTFAEGTLEVSAISHKNGMGKCVGTHGTGIFEGAEFTGTFDANRYWYEWTGVANVGFKIQEGTGEIMFT
jgi:hypothetical protein